MEKTIIETPEVARPVAPYSNAVRVKGAGNLIFVAGMAPVDVEGHIVCRGDIVGQTRQVVSNLIAMLAAAGVTPDSVVKTTTYVVDSAIREFLGTSACVDCLSPFASPVDTLIGVASMAGSEQGQLIEVDAIAVTG